MEIGTQTGPYRVDALLGKGGMAEVYKAWHTGLHRYEAMKVLPPQMTLDKSFVERFLNEARMAAGLQHPNIATIHTVSEPSCPQPYFTMELVEGGDLSDYLEAHGPFSLSAARPILEQIASALDFAHNRGLIHRDVKPANVLLKPDGSGGHVVKMVDFGIARAQEEAGGTRLTKTGMIVGTPEYMSPEQGGSGATVDHRTDTYSLGVIAYEMLCGQPPFHAAGDTSALSVIMRHVRDAPRPPLEHVPNLPKAANAAILKALAKNPADRFDSCAEFVRALGSAAPVAIPKPEITPKKSSRAVPMMAGAALLGGVALVALGVLHGGSSTQSTLPADNAPSTPDAPSVAAAPTKAKPFLVSVTVPDVVGKTEQQAKEIIKAKSLTADVTTGYSNAFEAQQVMSQHPPVGSSVAKGAPVRIRISLGPKASEQKPSVSALASSQSSTNTTTYRDNRRGWSLEYPSGWTVSVKYFAEDNRTRVEFAGPPQVSIIVDVSPDTSGQSPLESWQEMDNNFRRKYGGRYHLINLTESPLGGQPGARWAFTLRKSSEPRLTKIDRGTTYNGDGYALLFVAPADEFEAWQSIFDRAYLSFRFGGSSE